ncbi:MAG: NAD+ synthase [Pseudomonadota bacterium]
MKIQISQINTTIGDFSGNVSKIKKKLKKAISKGIDLVVFPELAICGYPPRDFLEKPSFIKKNEIALRELVKSVGDIGVIVGYAAPNPMPHGRGVLNNAAMIFQKKVLFEQAKTLLPSYDVFDETRYFDAASSQSVFKFKSKTIGIAICEDAWSEVEFGGRVLYSFDPLKRLKDLGAQIIIVISASPYHLEKHKLREKLIKRAALKLQVPIVYSNLVGGNDELVFDGRSVVADSEGNLVAMAKAFSEDTLIIDTEDMKPMQSIEHLPDEEELLKALTLGLKDYIKKCGFDKVLLGLSGGIDSALVATIAAKALGPKKVLAVSMPSPYTSKLSIKDARELTKNIGIELREIPIEEIYAKFRRSLKRKSKMTIVEENLQARIRGTILMGISNDESRLLLSTGNKSELAVGYCTLYGDMAGGFALISDLPKTLVYKLCDFINRKREIIPESIMKKAPSAELRPNQKDQDELPDYDVLDKILKLYIEEKNGEAAIVEKGFDKKIVSFIIKRVDKNEYKRRQMPVGIKVTSKAFGLGRRFPIACKIE